MWICTSCHADNHPSESFCIKCRSSQGSSKLLKRRNLVPASTSPDNLSYTDYVLQTPSLVEIPEIQAAPASKDPSTFSADETTSSYPELRYLTKFHTMPCRHFVLTGKCPFSPRCLFRHGDEEIDAAGQEAYAELVQKTGLEGMKELLVSTQGSERATASRDMSSKPTTAQRNVAVGTEVTSAHISEMESSLATLHHENDNQTKKLAKFAEVVKVIEQHCEDIQNNSVPLSEFVELQNKAQREVELIRNQTQSEVEQINKAAKSAVDQRDTEINELVQKLRFEVSQRQELNDKYQTLTSDHSRLKEQTNSKIDHFSQELKRLQRQHEDVLCSQQQQHDDRMNRMKADIIQLQQVHEEELRQQRVRANEEIENQRVMHSKTVDKLKHEIHAAECVHNQRQREMENHIQTINGNMAELREVNKTTSLEVVNLKEILRIGELALQESKMKYDMLKMQHEADELNAQRHMKEITEKILNESNRYQQQEARLNSTISELQVSLAQAKKETQLTHEDFDKERFKLKKLEQELNGVRQQLSAAQEYARQRDIALGEEQVLSGKLKQSVVELELQVTNSMHEISTLHDRVAEEKMCLDRLSAELSMTKHAKEMETSQLNNEIGRLRSVLENTERKEKMRNLECDGLRARLAESISNTQHEQAIAVLQSQLESTSHARSHLQGLVEKYSHECSSLETKLLEMISQHDASMALLQSQLDLSKSTCVDMQLMVDQSMEECTKLRYQLNKEVLKAQHQTHETLAAQSKLDDMAIATETVFRDTLIRSISEEWVSSKVLFFEEVMQTVAGWRYLEEHCSYTIKKMVRQLEEQEVENEATHIKLQQVEQEMQFLRSQLNNIQARHEAVQDELRQEYSLMRESFHERTDVLIREGSNLSGMLVSSQVSEGKLQRQVREICESTPTKV